MKSYVDLTTQDQNSSILALASIIFNKKDLNSDLTGLILNDSMETADIFCMILEIVLHGLNILTDSKVTIFNLNSTTDDLIYTINSYLKSMGIKMFVCENIMEDIVDLKMYKDTDNYYCQILNIPKGFNFGSNGWTVLNYRLIINQKFKYTKQSKINTFNAFFINPTTNQLFNINFDYILNHI